jgi:hypothetical protein
VPRVPRSWANQGQITAALRRAERALAPEVVRIRYDFGSDWTGDPSIFFRIVLSDEASRKSKLSETAQHVALTILNQVKAEELGLHSYFNYRSLAEQATLNEPAWA